MLYRPNFCCQCGEKIARATWTPLTSRRFCDFCAVEQKQHDLLPRAAAILALLIGAAGLTAYFGTGTSTHQVGAVAALSRERPPMEAPTRGVQTDLNRGSPSPSPAAVTNPASSNTKQPGLSAKSSTEPVYYCGAMTKKGTACTRRVKTPGRCWQHLGQPSLRPL